MTTTPQELPEFVSCRACEGTGYFNATHPSQTVCEECGGSGEIEEAPHPESAAPAVSDEAVERFNEWFCRNFPAGVVVGDPGWWSPRVLRAALDAAFQTLSAQVAAAKDWEARAMAAERKLREIEATRDREPIAWVERRNGEPYYSFGDEAIKWFDRHRARAEAAEQQLAAAKQEAERFEHLYLFECTKREEYLDKLAASEAALREAREEVERLNDKLMDVGGERE